MRKRIAAISLILVLMWSTVVAAWLPAAYAVVTWLTYSASAITAAIIDSYILHVSVGIAGMGIYYSMKNGGDGGKKVRPDGSVSREIDVTWVEIEPGNKLPVKQAQVEGRITYDKFIELLGDPANAEKYPNLRDAYFNGPKILGEDVQSSLGEAVSCGGHNGKITVWSNEIPFACDLRNPGFTYTGPDASGLIVGTIRYHTADGAGWKSYRSFRMHVEDVPPATPKTPGQAANAVANHDDPAYNMVLPEDVYSDRFGQEIDQFIKDNPNVVHFVDPVSGQDAKPPAATTAQIEAALAAQKAAQAQADATAAAQSAADAARARADAARSAANTARAASDANPGDAGLRDAAERAERAAQGLEGAAEAAAREAARAAADAAQKEKEQAEKDEAEGAFKTPSDNDYDPEIETPDKKGIAGLLDSIYASSPLISMIRGMAVVGQNPVSSFSCVLWGTNVSFDFSQWASIFSGVGSALLGVSHIAAIYLIFRRDE